jgi:16S rRNA (adenine1518-N6/adenine1519-N6)-dimethyltransferase
MQNCNSCAFAMHPNLSCFSNQNISLTRIIKEKVKLHPEKMQRMEKVRAKKRLGQHFLKDQNIAANIADGFLPGAPSTILEIGPGMGILTTHLLGQKNNNVYVVEIDSESVEFLNKNFPQLQNRIIEGDFLRLNLSDIFNGPIAIIGNFPYNISSQILFKIIENRNRVPQMVGMFQKEVAQRVAAGPGSKTYGILSVLLQAYYQIDYLFTVHEHVFDPPPKVKSGVIRLVRNQVEHLHCNEELFFRVVKTGFNQRRKTLANSLKPILKNKKPQKPIYQMRPEQLSVEQFIDLTNDVELLIKSDEP